MNLLVIEDDRKLNRMLCEILEKEGYTVKACTDGEEGAYYLQQNAYDLALVDWMLPGESGPDILRESRRKGIMTPVVMLTALTAVENKVTCLDAGADDYLPKPFAMGELLARVRAALRLNRYSAMHGGNAPAGEFRAQGMRINYDRRKVFVDEQEIKLTQTEYNIVAFLSQHAGRVMTYAAIVKAIWGDTDIGSTKKLQVNMANIRKKLGSRPGSNAYILNELGVGYRMIDEDARSGEINE